MTPSPSQALTQAEAKGGSFLHPLKVLKML